MVNSYALIFDESCPSVVMYIIHLFTAHCCVGVLVLVIKTISAIELLTYNLCYIFDINIMTRSKFDAQNVDHS